MVWIMPFVGVFKPIVSLRALWASRAWFRILYPASLAAIGAEICGA
jgi:hypothetical protein